MAPIKILIADDHPVVREGIAAMLRQEPDMQVVGEATNGREAVEKSGLLKPDVILMDLRMPVLDGAAAMQEIRKLDKDVKFIVLTTYDTEEYIFKAVEAGAQAYLLKDAPRDDLFKAIRAVSQGKSIIEPAIASKVLERFARIARQGPGESLSDRELEVLGLIAKGSANKEIAAALSVSESTVKTHIQAIFQKLDANSRTEAVAKAAAKGLVKL